jgi:hypothetical protein
MSTIATVPLASLAVDKSPVLAIANGIVPDEALAVSINLQFTSTSQAFIIDLTESARKFNEIPIQGAFIDCSGTGALNVTLQIPFTGQSIVAKAGTQGYYPVLASMPVRVIVIISGAPGTTVSVPLILYNTVIEPAVWGQAQGPIGPQGPQGLTGPQGTPGAGAPPATTTALGSVIIGANVSVLPNGTISVAAPPVPATATTAGLVKIGSNVAVLPDGTISVPPTAAFQTPWLSAINGAGFALNTPGAINNTPAIGIGQNSVAGTPLMVLSGANAVPVGITSTNASAGAITVYTNDASVQMLVGVGGSARSAVAEQSNGFVSVFNPGNLIFETSSTERMRVSQAGNVGIGTGTPQYLLDIRSPGSTATQVHIASTNTDAGAYLTSGGDSICALSAGAAYNGTAWIAKSSTATFIQQSNGATYFYSDAGLTPGSSYTPTQRVTISTAGNVGIGAGPPSAPLDVVGAIRATNGPFPTAGVGIEINYTSGANIGFLQSYDRGLSAYRGLRVEGIPIFLNDVSGGNVAIGNVTPTFNLHLANDSAGKPTSNTWSIVSDIRTKRNVERLKGGIDIVNRLTPIVAEYNGKAGTPEGGRVVSFDPAKLREVLPHAVPVIRGKLDPGDAGETDILGVNTHEILHHLVLAVQELSARLGKMEKRD